MDHSCSAAGLALQRCIQQRFVDVTGEDAETVCTALQEAMADEGARMYPMARKSQ